MIFLNCWRDRSTAWSGTPEGLYRALSKKIPLQQLDVYPGEPGRLGKIWGLLTLQLQNNHRIERQIDARVSAASGEPLLAFGEYYTKAVKDTYCYQDLSVDYLLRLRQQKLPYAHYALKRIIPEVLVRKKKKMADRFYRDCAGVFTMSAWIKEDLIRNTGLAERKVHHVGGGCSIDFTKINSAEKQGNKFLFVGKAWERKNGPLTAEAFRRLREKYPDQAPELYVAGPAQLPECLKGLEGVHYLGVLSYEALAEYYNLCDYFVMPSRFEAYGLVFAEALCFGLPCIGKNLCAMPEFIRNGENGWLIENDDPEELMRAMEKLLLEGKSMAQAVQNQREYYTHTYSWDTVADRIAEILKQDGYIRQKQ